MMQLFQITGSSSFAARAALDEAGAAYEAINIHPRNRDAIPAFAEVNPLKRVPALQEGDVKVYETGAVLLHIADRFPEAGLIPPLGDPRRPALADLAAVVEHRVRVKPRVAPDPAAAAEHAMAETLLDARAFQGNTRLPRGAAPA